MQGIRFVACAFSLALALGLTGCKTSSPLATAEARSRIEAADFTGSTPVQTVTFVSGAVETKPLAIDQFLYSKHWSACANNEGALQEAATCKMSSEGESYGRTNGWTSMASPTPSCPKCVTWTIPIAKATFKTVDSIDVQTKKPTTVTYTYAVVPNEFGTSLAEWTASHALAWCGDDPSAAGSWGKTLTNVVLFSHANGVWTIDGAAPHQTFAQAFSSAGAGAKPRECPAS